MASEWKRRLSAHVSADPLAATDASAEACAVRMLVCFHMSDDGVAMKRASLQPQFPEESVEQIAARVQDWLEYQPDPAPETGLRRVDWPRR